MTITLTQEIEELITEKVNSGAYKSPDEVVGAGLRLLSAKEQGIDALRREILVGYEDIQQGRLTSCASETELEEFSDGIIRQAQGRRDSTVR